ncbi:MAG: HEAT repeat domain-containing protein [Candidatus Helarchaeota archaeon]
MKDFQTLIKNLKSSDKTQIKESLENLGELNDKRAVNYIIELLEQVKDDDIIDIAVWNLSRIADPKDLIKLLNFDNKLVILYTIEALGRMEAKEFADYIRKFLDHKDNEIRSMAIWSIGKIKDEKSYDLIINLLKNDNDPEIRSNAAWTLKKLDIFESIPILKSRFYKEQDEMVLYNINDAIESIQNSHNKNKVDITFNIYSCKYKSSTCQDIKKEIVKFSDTNITIRILISDNCKKAKICGIEIK